MGKRLIVELALLISIPYVLSEVLKLGEKALLMLLILSFLSFLAVRKAGILSKYAMLAAIFSVLFVASWAPYEWVFSPLDVAVEDVLVGFSYGVLMIVAVSSAFQLVDSWVNAKKKGVAETLLPAVAELIVAIPWILIFPFAEELKSRLCLEDWKFYEIITVWYTLSLVILWYVSRAGLNIYEVSLGHDVMMLTTSIFILVTIRSLPEDVGERLLSGKVTSLIIIFTFFVPMFVMAKKAGIKRTFSRIRDCYPEQLANFFLILALWLLVASGWLNAVALYAAGLIPGIGSLEEAVQSAMTLLSGGIKLMYFVAPLSYGLTINWAVYNSILWIRSNGPDFVKGLKIKAIKMWLWMFLVGLPPMLLLGQYSFPSKFASLLIGVSMVVYGCYKTADNYFRSLDGRLKLHAFMMKYKYEKLADMLVKTVAEAHGYAFELEAYTPEKKNYKQMVKKYEQEMQFLLYLAERKRTEPREFRRFLVYAAVPGIVAMDYQLAASVELYAREKVFDMIGSGSKGILWPIVILLSFDMILQKLLPQWVFIAGATLTSTLYGLSMLVLLALSIFWHGPIKWSERFNPGLRTDEGFLRINTWKLAASLTVGLLSAVYAYVASLSEFVAYIGIILFSAVLLKVVALWLIYRDPVIELEKMV